MLNGSHYNNIYVQHQNARNAQLEIQTTNEPRSNRITPTRSPVAIVVNPVDGISTSISPINNRSPEDPPSYYEAVVSPSINELPPPSYDSLHGRVIEAQRQSTGVLDFTRRLFALLCGTITFTFITGFTIVIPVSMIVIGLIYLKQCPQGDYIPIYLLVGGCMGIVKQLLNVSVYVRHNLEDQLLERTRHSPTHRILNLFMLSWFVVGSYWVYRMYEPNYDPTQGIYCNRTLYLFSFWLITSVYIGLGLITVGLIIITFLSIILQRRSRRQIV